MASSSPIIVICGLEAEELPGGSINDAARAKVYMIQHLKQAFSVYLIVCAKLKGFLVSTALSLSRNDAINIYGCPGNGEEKLLVLVDCPNPEVIEDS